MMAPWEVEVIANRRKRGEKTRKGEDQTVDRLIAPTKAKAEETARIRQEQLEGSYEGGGSFFWNVRTNIKRHVPVGKRFIRRPEARRAPAVKDRRNRYHDKAGRLVSRKEALRRNRISQSMRKRWAAVRRSRRGVAALGRERWKRDVEPYGTWPS